MEDVLSVSLRLIRGFLLLALLGFAGRPQAALLGDVTGDNQVNVSDAVRLLRYIVQEELPTETQMILGDVFPRPGTGDRRVGDRRINVQDVIQLLRFTVGIISRADFGAEDSYLVLSPVHAIAGPLDQIQFTAVPVNLAGRVIWSISDEGDRLGELSTDGIYIAPGQIRQDATVVILARVGTMEASATVDLTEGGPPPPPPVRR
jgi:hypothetical protein